MVRCRKCRTAPRLWQERGRSCWTSSCPPDDPLGSETPASDRKQNGEAMNCAESETPRSAQELRAQVKAGGVKVHVYRITKDGERELLSIKER